MLATLPSSSFRHSFFESIFLFTIECSSPIEPFGFNALSFCKSILFVHLTTLRGGERRLVRTVGMVGLKLNTWRDPLWNFEQKIALTLRPPPQFYSCPPSTQTNIIVATSPFAFRWMRGPPRTGCGRRTTPIDICGANKQQESDHDMWTLLLLAATVWSFAHMPLDTNRIPCFPHGPHFSALYMHGGLTKRRIFSWICAHLAVFVPKLSDTVELV